MSHRNIVVYSLLIVGSIACRSDESQTPGTTNEDLMGLSVNLDPTSMSEVEGTWTGSLRSVGEEDSLGLNGSDVLAVVRVLEFDTDASEMDLSFRFDLDHWLTGIGVGGLMNNDIGDFEAMIHGPDGVTCMVGGDWSAKAEMVYVEFICNDADGNIGDYILEASPF